MSKKVRKAARKKWREANPEKVLSANAVARYKRMTTNQEFRKQEVLNTVMLEGVIGSVAIKEFLPYDQPTSSYLIMSLVKEGKLWYEKRTVFEDVENDEGEVEQVEKRRFFIGIPGKHELTREFPDSVMCGDNSSES